MERQAAVGSRLRTSGNVAFNNATLRGAVDAE
jgi:hypothetical protein